MTAKYSNKAVMLQNQASDEWSHYQAKSIKENVSKSRLDIMELFAKQNEADAGYKVKVNDLQQKITQYQKDQADIARKAKSLENERDNSQTLAKKLGNALVFLQIGILFSSLSSINKIYYFWYIGLMSGGYGVIDFLSIALAMM
jgi:succinate dehydrogenase/fumarate reductase flavoprotein subunit